MLRTGKKTLLVEQARYEVLSVFSILVVARYSRSSLLGILCSLGLPINTENADVAPEIHLTACARDGATF